MTQPASSLEKRLSWEDVLAAGSRREGERSFLLRLLQYLCQQYRLKAAGLYSKVENGFERQVSAGTEAFPTSLTGDEELAYESVLLPEGLLLFVAEGETLPDFEGPLILALSSALRAAILGKHLKQQSFAINYRGVELEALYDVGLAIASMLNLDQLGEEILVRAVSLLDARRGALYLRSGDEYVLDHTFGGDARQRLAVEDPQIEALIRAKLPADVDFLPGASYLMGLPFGTEDRPQGLLIVADKESRTGVGPFPDADRRSLSLFANQAAIALETAHLHRQALEKERLERELDLAADIQRRLLPTVFPRLEGFELAGWSRPARHVGGDYYDLLRLPGDRVAAILADVSGKGLPAALMVSTVHSALRLLVDQVDVGPELVRRLNHHIAESSAPNKFITLMLAELDPTRNEVRYVSAGHNPAIVVRADGSATELALGGLPLGLFDNSVFKSETVEFEPGDLMCIYSDGITESTSPRDEEFGPLRLIELLQSIYQDSLPEIISRIDQEVSEFAAGLSQADDQTLVLVRRSA
jgi:sigma-B regulation protein RsbU (phosphoserine phosphatase)